MHICYTKKWFGNYLRNRFGTHGSGSAFVAPFVHSNSVVKRNIWFFSCVRSFASDHKKYAMRIWRCGLVD